jgi:acyl CoA:acetate/3-ketoacid CoA transferase beta subunit
MWSMQDTPENNINRSRTHIGSGKVIPKARGAEGRLSGEARRLGMSMNHCRKSGSSSEASKDEAPSLDGIPPEVVKTAVDYQK